MHSRVRSARPALLVLGLLAGSVSCSANIDELDACFDLAAAYCESLNRCGLSNVDADDCREALGDQCIDHGDLVVGAPDSCASDLERSCPDVLPESCRGLDEDMGCHLCNAEHAPTAAGMSACCELEPLSAVCGGC